MVESCNFDLCGVGHTSQPYCDHTLLHPEYPSPSFTSHNPRAKFAQTGPLWTSAVRFCGLCLPGRFWNRSRCWLCLAGQQPWAKRRDREGRFCAPSISVVLFFRSFSRKQKATVLENMFGPANATVQVLLSQRCPFQVIILVCSILWGTLFLVAFQNHAFYVLWHVMIVMTHDMIWCC